MKGYRFATMVVLLVLCAHALAADNHGSFTRKREQLSMTAVYAGMTISELGSGVVVFTDTPDAIDHLAADVGNEPDNVESAIREQGANVVTLKILRNLKPMLWICGKDCGTSIPFDEKSLKLELTRYDDQRVEGTIKSVDKRSGMSADLAFALPLHNVAEASERQGPNYAHAPVGQSPLPAMPAPSVPDAPSALYAGGKAIGLVDSYAFAAQDEFDHDPKNRGRTVLVFTDGKMDKAALANADSVLQAVNEQNRAGRFEHIAIVRLLANGKTFIDLRGAEPYYAALGDDTEVLKLKHNDARHVEGSYLCKDPSEKRMVGHLCWDLHFALDVARAK
ncbi:MAG: hypothetical protein ABI846_04960 [Rudaea sp.]